MKLHLVLIVSLLAPHLALCMENQNASNDKRHALAERHLLEVTDHGFEVHKYSINMIWINLKRMPEQKYLSNAVDEAEVTKKIVEPAAKWEQANPKADINFWYDSTLTQPDAVARTRALFQKAHVNAHLRDIREIPIVRANPDVFSDQTPVYFRVDLLKAIVIVDAIERGKNDAAIFTDLEVGDSRPDGLRMNKKELFNESAMADLVKWGLISNSRRENQFLQLARHRPMIAAIKHAIINVNMARVVAALNNKTPGRTAIIAALQAAPYLSTIEGVHAYAQGAAAGSIKVLGVLVDPTAKEGEWIDYNPKEHGYLPLGLEFGRGGTSAYSFFKDEPKEVDEMIRLPKRFHRAERPVDVRLGNSHYGNAQFELAGHAASEDGVYRVKFWD